MGTILWTQNESPDIEPTIIVDGIKQEGDFAQKFFSRLNHINQDLAMPPELRERLYYSNKNKDKGFSLQANFKILNDNEGIYIQGCYDDKDYVGRRMPYMFFCNSVPTLEEAISVLKQESNTMGRSCNEYEMKALMAVEKKLKKKIFSKYIILLIIIIFIIWVSLSLMR